MSDSLTMPELSVGMIVVTPSAFTPYLTADKKYIILDVENDWVMVEDDVGDLRYYRAHLFIEADVYYNLCLYLTLMRMFGVPPNSLK
jgi:hypothetical protein